MEAHVTHTCGTVTVTGHSCGTLDCDRKSKDVNDQMHDMTLGLPCMGRVPLRVVIISHSSAGSVLHVMHHM